MNSGRHLLLWPDAGPGIGLGHVSRAVAVAQAWRQRGGGVTIVADPSVSDWVGPQVPEGRLIPLPAATDVLQASGEVAAIARAEGASWIVADGYRWNDQVEQRLVQSGALLAVFDDHHHGQHSAAELVIHPHDEPDQSSPRARAPMFSPLLANDHELAGIPSHAPISSPLLPIGSGLPGTNGWGGAGGGGAAARTATAIVSRLGRGQSSSQTACPDVQAQTWSRLILKAGGNAGHFPSHTREPLSSAWRLTGTRFVPLRECFTASSGPPNRDARWPRSILVTLGGADPINATQAVCEMLATSAFADRCRFTVLVGPHNIHREKIAAAIAGLPGHWRIASGRHDLMALFQASDLAITAASVTLYEMASFGLPFIALQTADNQRRVAESIGHSGAGFMAGCWPTESPSRMVECFDSLIGDPECMHRASVAGRAWIDGRGADRIVSRMLAGKLRVRLARPDDAVALWRLRNDPQVRANSLSQNPVSWATHRNWFERLLADPGRLLFVLMDSRGEVAGQCRMDFEPLEASVTISIALADELRGCSVAAGLISHALALLPAGWQFERLVAEIRQENQPSRALFKSLGFTDAGQASRLS